MHWTVYLMFAVYLVSVTVVGGREETVLKWRWTKSRNVQQCLNGCGWLSHGGWRPLWFHEWFQWLPRKNWFTATPSGHRTDLHMLANNQHWLQSVSVFFYCVLPFKGAYLNYSCSYTAAYVFVDDCVCIHLDGMGTQKLDVKCHFKKKQIRWNF